jgi:hypothetical protein
LPLILYSLPLLNTPLVSVLKTERALNCGLFHLDRVNPEYYRLVA